MPTFTSPAALRQYYGWNTMYPPGQISRVPDGADWPSGTVTGVGGYASIPGYVGPEINGNSPTEFWDAGGKLLTANQLATQVQASGQTVPGLTAYATSLADAYDPSSAHFGDDIEFPNGSFQRFDPVLATSVAGRMANLGESQSVAESNATAAAQKLGLPAPSNTTAGRTADTQWASDVAAAEANLKSVVTAFIQTALDAEQVATENRAAAQAAADTAITTALQTENAKLDALKTSLQTQLDNGSLTLADAESELQQAEDTARVNVENVVDQAIAQYAAQTAPTDAQAAAAQAAAQAATTAAGSAGTSAATQSGTPAAAGLSGKGAVIGILAVLGAYVYSQRKGK